VAGVREVFSRGARIVLMTAGSSMPAMILIAPPQCSQISMSTLKTRFRRCAEAHGGVTLRGCLVRLVAVAFPTSGRGHLCMQAAVRANHRESG